MRTEEDKRIDAGQIYDELFTFAVSPEVKTKIIECVIEGINWGEECVLRDYSEDTGRVAGVIYRNGQSLVSTVTIMNPTFDAKNGSYVDILMKPLNNSENECLY